MWLNVFEDYLHNTYFMCIHNIILSCFRDVSGNIIHEIPERTFEKFKNLQNL